jgi:hypothetical protein
MESASTTNLSCNVTIRIEEAKGIVRAAEHSDTNFGDVVIRVRCCLRSSEWALVVRIADVELIVVCGVWPKVLCFNL